MGDPRIGEALGSEHVDPDRPSWESFVERVVADVRTNFGSPVASEIARVLADHRSEAEAALSPALDADEELAAAVADRREAEELVRDAVNNWRVARSEADTYAEEVRDEAERQVTDIRRAVDVARLAAEAELDRVAGEIAQMRRQLDDIEAPLDAREAELVAWEAELTQWATALGASRPASLTPPKPANPAEAAADGRAHRADWRAPAPPPAGAGRRGWGRRSRPDRDETPR